MKSGKRESVERIELPNQKCIKKFGEKEIYKYLGMLEVDTVKQVDKGNNKKRVPPKSKKDS